MGKRAEASSSGTEQHGRAPAVPAADTLDILMLRCSETGFALELEAVAHASFLVAVQPVPEAPEYVLGVAPFRDDVVPVLDLAGRLGLQPADRYDLETPVVWCRAGGRTAGLVVDDLPGIAEVAGSELRMRQEFATGGPPVEGVVRTQGQAWLLLDPARILDFDFARRVSDIRLDKAVIRKWLEEADAVEPEAPPVESELS
jgi:purine-binding chemotaxis protein CheW